MTSHYSVESVFERSLLSDSRVTFHDKHETRRLVSRRRTGSGLGTQDSLSTTGMYQMTENLNGTRRSGPSGAALST